VYSLQWNSLQFTAIIFLSSSTPFVNDANCQALGCQCASMRELSFDRKINMDASAQEFANQYQHQYQYQKNIQYSTRPVSTAEVLSVPVPVQQILTKSDREI
jgi:hypothetical protein